ncbi:MAG: HK97 gp10 family phage protein [Clostridia bacterium]|jgi:hypothetical protein
MKIIAKVETTYNATAPKYSGAHSESLGGFQVIEDTVFKLGARLTEREDVFKAVAEERVLVDTGELRDSIGVNTFVYLDKIEIVAYARARHAGYIEFGTSRWKYKEGVPYIRPALREAYSEVLGSDFVENRLIPSIWVWYPTSYFG